MVTGEHGRPEELRNSGTFSIVNLRSVRFSSRVTLLPLIPWYPDTVNPWYPVSRFLVPVPIFKTCSKTLCPILKWYSTNLNLCSIPEQNGQPFNKGIKCIY